MNQKVFLFEKNEWRISRLSVLSQTVYIVENKITGKRYVRKSMAVVKKIIKGVSKNCNF